MRSLLLLLLNAIHLVSTANILKNGGVPSERDEKEQDKIQFIGISAEQALNLTRRLNQKQHQENNDVFNPEYDYTLLIQRPSRILGSLEEFIHGRNISQREVKEALDHLTSSSSTDRDMVKKLSMVFMADLQNYFASLLLELRPSSKDDIILFFLWLAYSTEKSHWTLFLLNYLPEEALPFALVSAIASNDLECVRCILRNGYVPFALERGPEKSLDWESVFKIVQESGLPIAVLLLETLQKGELPMNTMVRDFPRLTIAATMMEPGWLRNQMFTADKIPTGVTLEQLLQLFITRSWSGLDFPYHRFGGIKYVLSIASVIYAGETDNTEKDKILMNLGVSRSFMEQILLDFSKEWADAKTSKEKVQLLSKRGISLPLPSHPFDPRLSDLDFKEALDNYKFYENIDQTLSKFVEFQSKSEQCSVDEGPMDTFSDEDHSGKNKESTGTSNNSVAKAILAACRAKRLYKPKPPSGTEKDNISATSTIIEPPVTRRGLRVIPKNSLFGITGNDLRKQMGTHRDLQTQARTKLPKLLRSPWTEETESLESLVASATSESASSLEGSRIADMSRSSVGDEMASSADLTSSTFGMDLSSSLSTSSAPAMSDSMSLSLNGSDMCSSGHPAVVVHPSSAQQPPITVSPWPRSVSGSEMPSSIPADEADDSSSRTVSPETSPIKPGLMLSETQSLSGSAMSVDEAPKVPSPARRALRFDSLTDPGKTVVSEHVEVISDGENETLLPSDTGLSACTLTPNDLINAAQPVAVDDVDAPTVLLVGPSVAGDASVVSLPGCTIDTSRAAAKANVTLQEQEDIWSTDAEDLTHEASVDEQEQSVAQSVPQSLQGHSAATATTTLRGLLIKDTGHSSEVLAAKATSNVFERPTNTLWDMSASVTTDDDDGSDQSHLEISRSTDAAETSELSLGTLKTSEISLDTLAQSSEQRQTSIAQTQAYDFWAEEARTLENENQWADEIDQNGEEDRSNDEEQDTYGSDDEEDDVEFHERLTRISKALKLNRQRAASLPAADMKANSRTRASSIPASFKLRKEHTIIQEKAADRLEPRIIPGGEKTKHQVPLSTLDKATAAESKLRSSSVTEGPGILPVPGGDEKRHQTIRNAPEKDSPKEPRLSHASASEAPVIRQVKGGHKISQQAPRSASKVPSSEPRPREPLAADLPVIRLVKGGDKSAQQVTPSAIDKAPSSEPYMDHHDVREAPVIRPIKGGEKAPNQAPHSSLEKAPIPEPHIGHAPALDVPVIQNVKGGDKASQQVPHSSNAKAPSSEPSLGPLMPAADFQVPSPQSAVDLAFSSVENLAQFAPVGPYTVGFDTLSDAPANIFSVLTPELFRKMVLFQKEKLTKFFESEAGLAMLTHLVADGESCAYEHVGKLFSVLGPIAFASLKKEALLLIDPSYFALLSEEHFGLVDFSVLLPDQIAQIPAPLFAKLSLPHAQQLKNASLDRAPAYSPCSGLTAEQLSALPSKNIFMALGEACQKQISCEALYAASKEVVSWIPSKFFEQSLAYDQPGLESLIQNATIEQISHIPQVYAVESHSPFFGLTIDLATFGGEEHQRAMRTISPQTIEIVDPESLKSMGSGDFGLLSDEVRRNITCESFGYIPPSTISVADVLSLSVQNTKLCPHLTPEHFSDLPSTVSISSVCAGLLPKATWDFLVSSGAKLPSSFLAHATAEHTSDLSSITSSDSLTASHWSKLGTGLPSGEEHPCESIRFSDVSGVEGFWKGINLACFASLPCLDELTEEQFKLVKTSVRDHLPLAVMKGLPEELQKKFFSSASSSVRSNQITPTILARLSAEEISKLSSQDFAELPLETFASLKKEHAEMLVAKKDLLEHVTAGIVASCSPEFLSSLTAEQIDLIPADACAGLTRDHLASLDLSVLPPTSFAFIEPIQFTSLSVDQLARIPEEAWSSAIFKEQVESIEPAVLAQFMHFDQFGADVDPLSPHHPCLGITDRQRSSFEPSVQEAFEKQCKPVFDSHDLEKSMAQRTQKSE